MSDYPFQSCWTVIFSRKRVTSLCLHVKNISKTRSSKGKNKHESCLLPTGLCHSALCLYVFYQEHVSQTASSRFGDFPLPSKSSDLPGCDIFLWEHLKERVYTHKPWTLTNLKQAITEEVQSIQPHICRPE